MNKIRKLLDQDFVMDYFHKKVLPLYPDFEKIERIKIIAHKKLIWESTYHVVFEFETRFLTRDGRQESIPIFCTAHSNEPRENVYTSLRYLWEKGFNSGNLSIPHPLFYSKYFQGTFYRGVEGKTLYYYIRNNKREIIDEMLPKAAGLFSKLHLIDPDQSLESNNHYSRIETINPGTAHILDRIRREHPDYYRLYEQAYAIFLDHEKRFFSQHKKRWLVHGDAHPENIIRMNQDKIALIDFTDLSLADFARDLGSFTQQLEYMIGRKLEDPDYARRSARLFLDSYFLANPEAKTAKGLEERINIYYNWTCMRTATHFLLKTNIEPARAEILMKRVAADLNLNY